MAACGQVPLSTPLQIGATSGCVARHGMKQTRANFGEFSRIVRLRALRSKRVGSGFGQMASARGDYAAPASTSTSHVRETAERQSEAAEMVQEFYAAINRREIASIGDLFADDCVYEDLVFPKPFVGRRVMIFQDRCIISQPCNFMHFFKVSCGSSLYGNRAAAP